MATGKVRAWVENCGYGFIRPEGSADDVFVHISALADGVDRLNFGAHLEFETGISPRNGKLRVVNVRVVG
jgi:CspA family cold shock protein